MSTHTKSQRTARKRSAAKTRNTQKKRTQEIAVTITGVNGQPLTIYAPNEEAVKFLLRDEELYNRYAKHLEAMHKGEFVAIGLDGEIIVTDNMTETFLKALEKFGPQNFALHRIGYDTVMRV